MQQILAIELCEYAWAYTHVTSYGGWEQEVTSVLHVYDQLLPGSRIITSCEHIEYLYKAMLVAAS